MMSFNRSVACGVTAFETDVQLRYRANGSTLTFDGSGGAYSRDNENTTAPLTLFVVFG